MPRSRSVFVFWTDPLQLVGVWLFIIGSLGMLVGDTSSFVLKYERHELNL